MKMKIFVLFINILDFRVAQVYRNIEINFLNNFIDYMELGCFESFSFNFYEMSIPTLYLHIQ